MRSAPIQVLLVDDDPVFTHLACQMVKSVHIGAGCRITALPDGEAALKEIHRRAYDLALLDYHLPGVSGLDVLAGIQKLPVTRQPAVIMLTAGGNESVAVEAMKRGARDYLTKANLDLASLTRAIQNAVTQKRLTEQVEAYNAQLEADLEMARKLQRSLLPQHYPMFPRSAREGESLLRFAHRFSWTTQLGGDFFSVQPLSDTQAGVFICDVMGHGVRSALVTSMLRVLVGDLAAEAADPDRFLSTMNQRLTAMLKETGETLFATAFYMIADVQRGRLRYARAGHPPPLHLHRGGGTAEALSFPKSAGPALGLFPAADYITCECALAPGDVLLLFTDGLFEVTDPDGDDFGAERLLEAAKRRMQLPLGELLDGLIEEVRSFAEGEEFEDDACLLGMEVAGPDIRC